MNTKAFTLLELLIVVLIISILATISLPQYQRAVLKSKYSSLKTLTRAIFDAESRYYLTNGSYTDNLESLDIQIENNNNIFCSVEVYDNDIECYYRNNNKVIFIYLIKIGGNFGTAGSHKRCFAYSTNQNDNLNKVCQEETGHSPYNDCKKYCAYKYEEE